MTRKQDTLGLRGQYCLLLCEWRKYIRLSYLHPTYLINTVSQQQEGFRLLDSMRSKLMSRDCCKRKEVLFRSHGTWGKGGLPSQSPISLSAQAPPPPFFSPLSIIFLGFDCAEGKHPGSHLDQWGRLPSIWPTLVTVLPFGKLNNLEK